MQYQSFLIKYAEIGTKGKNRYMFEDALIKQIRYALKSVEGQFDVTKESGRIYVKAEGKYDYEDTVEALGRVFGIADICPMVQIEDKDYENLKQHVVEYMDQVYPDKNITFKVNARRGDKQYPVTSEQINRDMGEVILEAFPQMRVDVHHPDVILHVEVRQRINLFSLMIPGPGGMPVGTNGRAMLLLSGGIDSPVAGYMIAKRGVKIDAVYFHAPPYTSERAKQKVVDCRSLKDWRTGRSVFGNLIPSTTGAAKAISLVIPSLKDKMNGISYRVPTSDVSIVDLNVALKSPTSYEDICRKMKEASENELSGILDYIEDEVVSSDFIGDSHASCFDAREGIQVNSHFFKLIAFYDNEWGYTSQIFRLIRYMNRVDLA